MFALATVLLSCSGYVFTQNTACRRFFPSEKYDAAPIPNEQELNSMCPDILKYLDCYWAELQEDPEKYSDSHHMYYNYMGRLLRDLCTDGMQIRQDYLASHACFKNVQDEYQTCLDEVKLLYEQWKVLNPEDDPRIDEHKCFIHSNAMGCIAHRIKQTCGNVEYSTYLQILERSRYLSPFCGPVSVEDLYSEYMELLNLKEINNKMNKNNTDTVTK